MESVAYVPPSAPEISASGRGCSITLELERLRSPDTRVERDERATRSKVVRDMQRARRRRDAVFGAGLFADPAWDMLLELYASHLEQRRIAVSSLCIASQVPATTALRWITKLEQDGLAVRKADPSDGRRSWIELTQEGLDRISSCFETRSTNSFS